ncbi:hypothetical protein AHAS_Ahas16G0086200 [Arachis hypogaea]
MVIPNLTITSSIRPKLAVIFSGPHLAPLHSPQAIPTPPQPPADTASTSTGQPNSPCPLALSPTLLSLFSRHSSLTTLLRFCAILSWSCCYIVELIVIIRAILDGVEDQIG